MTSIETSNGQLDGASRARQASVEFFLGPILPLLSDDTVTEVMINGPHDIFVERAGRIEQVDARFEDEAAVRSAANNIAQYVGKSIDDSEPILDGRLPDGSRVCIVLATIAAGKTSINIRRFSHKANTADFLLEKRSITPEALEFVQLAVRGGLNIVVSGGTGSGKTTILNILSNEFRDTERIVVIEDTRELQVQKEHVVQMEARPPDAYGRGQITVRDLFVTSLRMRPDRIVVGEVRRGEALDMVQAMTSGHRGSLATLHADTPAQTCGRLETMCMMADIGLPLAALRRQVALALDLVVQSARLHSGRRLITHISEVGLDEATNSYVIHDLFNLDTTTGEPVLVWTGRRPMLADDLAWKGLAGDVNLTKEIFAAKDRTRRTARDDP